MYLNNTARIITIITTVTTEVIRDLKHLSRTVLPPGQYNELIIVPQATPTFQSSVQFSTIVYVRPILIAK